MSSRVSVRRYSKIPWTTRRKVKRESRFALQYGRYPPKSYIPNAEKKAASLADGLDLNTTGEILLLNGIARGDALNERIGRKVMLKSITFRGIAESTGGTGVAQMGRLIVVYDKQTNATEPAITDILDSAHAASLMNLSNSNRFKVLIDVMIPIRDRTSTNGDSVPVYEYRNLNLPMHFNSGDAGTVGDIISGAIWAIGVGNVAVGATDGNLSFRSRVRYTDF